ncbi:hypothetical protein [Algibacter sp. L1A34]|nr:hypothetical protein [Algibacter sp. L1A34]
MPKQLIIHGVTHSYLFFFGDGGGLVLTLEAVGLGLLDMFL